MKICLIYPDDDKKCNDPGASCHLGIAYVASFLKKHSYHVDLYDCAPMQIKTSQMIKILVENNYDAIGLSAYIDNYAYVLRIVNYIKTFAKNTFIFVGGHLPSLAYDQIINDLQIIDCLMLGDGELTTLHLIENLKENKWKNTKGFVYKKGGCIINTGPGMAIENIDEIPFPIRLKTQNREIYILTSRGCIGKCSYFPLTLIQKIIPAQELEKEVLKI